MATALQLHNVNVRPAPIKDALPMSGLVTGWVLWDCLTGRYLGRIDQYLWDYRRYGGMIESGYICSRSDEIFPIGQFWQAVEACITNGDLEGLRF